MGHTLKLMSAPMLGMLSMCSTVTPPSNCDGWAPIYPTRADVEVISDQLAGQVLAHDMHGQKTCNWKPPTKSSSKTETERSL